MIRILPEGEKNNTETAAGLVKSALEGGFFPGSGSVAAAFFRCGRAVRGDGCGCGKRGAERNPSAAGTGFRRGRGNSAPGGRAQKRQDHWHSGADLEKIQRGFCPIGSTYTGSARERFGATIGVGLTDSGRSTAIMISLMRRCATGIKCGWHVFWCRKSG